MTFDAEKFLEGLKPFQRDTVEYVFGRFFDSTDPVDRFLVADEVGLGKTMVAKGLVAKLIERHLQEPGRRIDIVYICSNQAIAQQNFSKLAIVGRQRKAVTDRITTLPLHVAGLNEPVEGFGRGINVIPITPTTSLDLRSNVGRVDERALLWWLLSDERLVGRAMRSIGSRRVFTPPVADVASFAWRCDQINPARIDADLWRKFIEILRRKALDVPELNLENRPILQEVQDLASDFRYSDKRPCRSPWRERRIRVVGALRRALAESCVNALEPDLVILDEFQRFPKLLKPGEPTGELARQLFDYEGCKSLLLSATPYKMFSRARELDETHHAEFMVTTDFLLDDQARSQRLGSVMGSYRQALRAIAADGREPVERARNAVYDQLSRVMCRTERLGAAGSRNGMLDASPQPALEAKLAREDLYGYAELEHVARSLRTRDVVEFWKSAPYALNLMDDYALTREFVAQAGSEKPLPISHRLDPDAVRQYQALDPGNARLRGLLERLDEEDAWKCLWLPPALPYYTPAKPFNDATLATKRLVFSQWQVVPKAIAALTSYHVERRIFEHAGQAIENSAEGRKTVGSPLQWRPGGALSEVLLIAPGRKVARLTDPLVLAAARSADGGPARREDVLADAERAVATALRELGLPSAEGRADGAWYLVAMLRLDEAARPGSTREWLHSGALGGDEGSRAWDRHRARLESSLTSDEGMGAVPKDLARVLAYVGVGGPGTCALRALQRSQNGASDASAAVRALELSNALRLMLNLPESVSIVRGFANSRSRIQTTDEEIYWRAVLDYSIAGNLQSVLDEYVHVLAEWVGGSGEERLTRLVATAVEAVGVQAASLQARDISGEGRIEEEPLAFRSRFALRLDRGQGEDQKAVQRVDTVRKAFNSPFWPFVLTTTSIGQEGLDFHLYSHAVVHWNLPYNPVDLEQREGRVHRFKNHAVRRNLATVHRGDAFAEAPTDPWSSMFDAVLESDKGLRPFWIFPVNGGAQIERHVPAEPLSVDHHRLDELVRLMGMYRLAFGQPRQEEFVSALAAMGGIERPEELAIDLSPPSRSGRPPRA